MDSIAGTSALWPQIVNDANLRLAWRRASQYFAVNCSYFVDYAAIATFNMNLEANLRGIAEDFASGRYQMEPLRLAPQPKPKHDRASPPLMREIFWLAPRDQVAWLAVANVIGRLLDDQMPDWSYGHRLNDGPGSRPIRQDNKPSDHFVWPPGLSWPICQRHVVLTARHLRSGRINPSTLNPDERTVWQLEMDRPLSRQLPYLAGGSSDRAHHDLETPVYHAAFDFKSFSGNLRLHQVLQGMRIFLPQLKEEPQLSALIERMLEFKVDLTGISAELAICETMPCPGRLNHLPIGLIVQGFLANVAMLPIDTAVSHALTDQSLAHFRFLDDHIVLSTDINTLCDWLCDYRKIVRDHAPLIEINHRKTKPSNLADYLKDDGVSARHVGSPMKIAEAAALDPDEPQKLWPLSPLPSDLDRLSSSRSWGMRLSNMQIEAIRAELRDSTIPAKVALEETAGTDRDNEAFHNAIFSGIRNMLFEFPARGQMLRKALLFLIQTGFSGMQSLRADLEALATSSPAVAVSQISLLLQQLAPLLPSIALRLADHGDNPERRAAAAAFLLDLAALETPILPTSSEWYLERSRASFYYGLRIARAVLSNSYTDSSATAVISLLDRLLEHWKAAHGIENSADTEHVLLYWNGPPLPV